MISPVWLQIKRKPSGTFHITGTHDIDHEWVREVRKRGKKTQVKSKIIEDEFENAYHLCKCFLYVCSCTKDIV